MVSARTAFHLRQPVPRTYTATRRSRLAAGRADPSVTAGLARPRESLSQLVGRPWASAATAQEGAADSFRFPDPVSLKVERTGQSSGRIKLPKLGWVKVRERNWRTLPGSICNITISRRAGQWFAAVQCEQDVAEPAPSALPPVGIDMGIAVFAALSDGGRIAPGNYGKKALRALRTAQRSLSRKRQGSSNRRKAVRR